MSNNLLTPNMITKEALRILHQKLSFVGTINRQYDSSFAQEGAKIGSALRIRRPVEYITQVGSTMSTGAEADTVEQEVTLNVSTQRHVPLVFTAQDLTLDLDSFSSRIVEPAMARMAANIEADVLNGVASGVPNAVIPSTPSTVTFRDVLLGRKKLADNLAPMDGRAVQLDTGANVDLVDALKGLFHDQTNIKQQYREGIMGRTASFDFYENTLLPGHTRGGANTGYLVNGANQVGADSDSGTLAVDTGTGTLNAGDVFTIAGVYRVHPETKLSTGELMQFTVLQDHAGGAGTLQIAPGIVTGATAANAPRQNVTNSPADNAAITVLGTANTQYQQSLMYHKDAFVFATADLIMPEGVDFASRQVYDGISMRIVRDYDIVQDRFLCRLDVLYGYRTLYRQLAARILHT